MCQQQHNHAAVQRNIHSKKTCPTAGNTALHVANYWWFFTLLQKSHLHDCIGQKSDDQHYFTYLLDD